MAKQGLRSLLERGSFTSAPVVTMLTKPPREVVASGRALGAPGEPFISSRSTHGPLPPSFPFPTTLGSCLATWLASVGKHYWLCLYSGAEVFFCISLQWRTMKRLKSQSQQGPRDLPTSWVLPRCENTWLQSVTWTARRSLQGGIYVFSHAEIQTFKKLRGRGCVKWKSR